MTTPQEFAIKTDSSWVYPLEMYVYNGTSDKQVQEVYAWTGSEAVLVWPVPGNEPGTTHGTEGENYPLASPPADYKMFTPVFLSGNQGSSDKTFDQDIDIQTQPASFFENLPDGGCGAEDAPSGNWETDRYGGGKGTLFAIASDYYFGGGTPAYWDDNGGTPQIGLRNIESAVLINGPDTTLNQDFLQWRLTQAHGDVPFVPWDYNAQGSTPLCIPNIKALEVVDSEDPGGPFEYDYFPRNYMGGLDYQNDLGLNLFVLRAIGNQTVEYAATDEDDCLVKEIDLNISMSATQPSYPGQVEGPFGQFQNELNGGRGLEIEPFPQGADIATWDKTEPYVPEPSQTFSILNGIDTAHEYVLDTNIASFEYKKLDGSWLKLRMDNFFGINYNDWNSTSRAVWMSGIGTNGTIVPPGGWMVRYLPWKNTTGTAFGNEERTLFDPEYTKDVMLMSQPYRANSQSPNFVFGGYDYWKENFTRTDFITTTNYANDAAPQRIQGLLLDADNFRIRLRKDFSEAKLLWEEVGVVVGATGGSGTAEYFNCTPGTRNSFFPSGNGTMTRRNSSRLPRYSFDGWTQLEYDDYNCTNGDYRNYDGDFQQDFFDRSPYVELRIYNRTTGEWMRSHAWGDMPQYGNDNSWMVSTTAATYYNASHSRLRPIFLMNPKWNATEGAVNRFADFYSPGDIIDFKLYSR